jgi:hypothetical protein
LGGKALHALMTPELRRNIRFPAVQQIEGFVLCFFGWLLVAENVKLETAHHSRISTAARSPAECLVVTSAVTAGASATLGRG